MMKDFKNYLKSYKFWLSVFSALFLILEAILKPFNVILSEESYMTFVNIILGFLVFLGIISVPKDEQAQDETKQDEMKQNKKVEDEELKNTSKKLDQKNED